MIKMYVIWGHLYTDDPKEVDEYLRKFPKERKDLKIFEYETVGHAMLHAYRIGKDFADWVLGR